MAAKTLTVFLEPGVLEFRELPFLYFVHREVGIIPNKATLTPTPK